MSQSLRDPHWRTRQSAMRAAQRDEAAKKLHQFIRDEKRAKLFRLAHRTRMVAGFPNPSDRDQKCEPTDSRAGYPLGILYLRGDITEAEYDAGLHYAQLHFAQYGSGATRSALASIQVDSPEFAEDPYLGDDPLTDEEIEALHEEAMARSEIKLSEAALALQALPTSRPYHVFCNIALYEQGLRFMDTSNRRSHEAVAADARDLLALKLALDTLAALPHRRRPHARP